MHKVLVSENIADIGIDILAKKTEVDFKPNINRDDLLNTIGDYDAIIVRSMTALNKEALEKAKNLKVIGRAGTGYDNIDIEEATKRGIVVFNTPFGNTISAVEHTLGMLLALSRNIAQANEALHEGIWDRKKYMGTEVKGKTLGIIGLGKIGSRVAKRARSFGMKVIANDPYLSPEIAKRLNVPLLPFKEVLQQSDYISLHTPLTDETYYILSHKEFAVMKDNVKIINCARGENIDTSALAQAIKDGKIAGAAIDVHEQEPLKPDLNPLTKYKDKVIMTCHLGGTTHEAMDNVSIAAAQQVLTVLNDKLPDSPLNIPEMEAENFSEIKPYLNLTEKVGHFLAYWKGHERIKSIELEYGGKITDYKLQPFTVNAIKSILEPVLDSRINLVNARLIAKERAIKIKESYIEETEGLKNIIRINIVTEKGQYSIAGTSLPIGLRVIEINKCRIDLELMGNYLITTYEDKPGVIGKVGSILGEYKVNIARMQVGRKKEGGEAIMLVQTDSRPSEDAIKEISNKIGVFDCCMLPSI